MTVDFAMFAMLYHNISMIYTILIDQVILYYMQLMNSKVNALANQYNLIIPLTSQTINMCLRYKNISCTYYPMFSCMSDIIPGTETFTYGINLIEQSNPCSLVCSGDQGYLAILGTTASLKGIHNNLIFWGIYAICILWMSLSREIYEIYIYIIYS